MLGGDTIVALASPNAGAARALVRLSGPMAIDALRALGADPPDEPALAALRLPLAPGGAPMPVLAMLFRAPRSYTSEDAADLLPPGNPALVRGLIDRLALVDGVRLAGPGEFTLRALLAGRLTPEQAEGVAMTIAAESKRDLHHAARLRTGEAGAEHRSLADDLADTLALVEAGIDFTDEEDVRPIAPEALRARLEAMLARLDDWLSGAGARESARETPTVVLAGAPNAGKSTLFNALLARRRAVVSETPGATRDALVEPLDLTADTPGGVLTGAPSVVSLVDLAGLDEALTRRSPVDAAAQKAARDAIADADAILLCDPGGRFDLPLPETRATILRVRTKADLPEVPGASADALSVCALDRWNLPALRRAIADAAFAAGGAEGGALPARQRRAMERTRAAVGAARVAAEDADAPEELIAASLREALDAIGEIAGAASPDDVIGRIFASFCIGK